MFTDKRLFANKCLLSTGLGLVIAFGLCFSLAQANSQVVQLALPAAAILYVDANANGEATGLDWANAFTTLQDALTIAVSGDQVWAAEGVYYPDEGSGQVNNAVASTFVLTNGVAIYGGFDPTGGADTFAQRDWVAHPTVLSGDIDHETNPDITDAHGVVATPVNIHGLNTEHVVSSHGVSETASLDGLIITAGRTDIHACGGGMYNNGGSPTLFNIIFSGNQAFSGGGMCNESGDPTLINVTFSGNFASVRGGGMYNLQNSPMLTGVSFFGNSSGTYGGGMFNEYSSPMLTHATFSGNKAWNHGGGMANYSSSPTLTNAIFSGNSANTTGGGMFNTIGSSPTLTHVTFSGNEADESGGGMQNIFESSPTLTNTVFWGNQAGTMAQIFNWDSDSRPQIYFSDIQDAFNSSGVWNGALGIDGGNNLDIYPRFARNPDPGDDGEWDGVDDDYGDLRLRPGSPVINTGTNQACPATDLDGGPRPLDGVCDMGAYETGYALLISKTVDQANPRPGETITFTIVVDNRDLNVTGGLIADALPAGLNFLGPISLQPAGNGSVGNMPPVLASGLAISYTDRIVVTFPVTVSYGLISGTRLINTVAVSATEVITPALASVTVSVQNTAPVAVADVGAGFNTDKDTAFTTASVLSNDNDPNGDTLIISGLDTGNTLGLVTNNGDGTFTYNPNGHFAALGADDQATDVFTYTVSDGQGGSDSTTVTITIFGVQDGFSIYLPLLIR